MRFTYNLIEEIYLIILTNLTSADKFSHEINRVFDKPFMFKKLFDSYPHHNILL